MPFDINDPNVQNVLVELEGIDPVDVEEVTRDRRNYLTFLEGQSQEQYVGISMRERSFNKKEFNKVVNTEIKELS